MSTYLGMSLLVLDTNCYSTEQKLKIVSELSKGFIMEKTLLESRVHLGHRYDTYERPVSGMGEAARLYQTLDDVPFLSMYIDMDDSLGCVGEPYMEIFIYSLNDTVRIKLSEISEYQDMIELEEIARTKLLALKQEIASFNEMIGE